ncbi:MAG TPA: hypothetical protein VGO59_07135 [Verrucomicrobiae bacterium]|jgi:hypothetical protein
MKSHIRKLVLAALLAVSSRSAQAQATTQVMPRAYPVFNSQLLTSLQALPPNAIQTNVLSATVAGQTNTFIPYSGAHAIGLVCQIVNTNAFAQSSNVIIYVYPAYDSLGGNGSSLNGRYGTNFSTTPVLAWTIGTLTNTIASTNLLAGQWEPATSLGFCITNTTKSNLVVTLTQYVCP